MKIQKTEAAPNFSKEEGKTADAAPDGELKKDDPGNRINIGKKERRNIHGRKICLKER
jgi:hypothetical protein